MTDIAFHLVAEVSSQSPDVIANLLEELVDGKVTSTPDGFHVDGFMRGTDARELNRFLLSALRRVERRTRLRSEWTTNGETQRFFDYVPKGQAPPHRFSRAREHPPSRGQCPPGFPERALIRSIARTPKRLSNSGSLRPQASFVRSGRYAAPFKAHRRHLVLSANLVGSEPLPSAPRLLVTPPDALDFVSITVNPSPPS